MSVIYIMAIGQTGDGKSTVLNCLLKELGYNGPVWFKEGDRVKSQTMEPTGITVDGHHIVDTPGMLDPEGEKMDKKNLTEIVKFMKKIGHMNMFLLVLNEATPRLTNPMQDALKLFHDSFGRQMWNNVAIVFTHSIFKKPNNSKKFVEEQIRPEISKRLGYDIPSLPSYQIEAHPEEIEGFTEDHKRNLILRNGREISDLLQLARNTTQMSLDKVEVAETTHEKELKKRKLERDTARAQAKVSMNKAAKAEEEKNKLKEQNDQMEEKNRKLQQDLDIERQRERIIYVDSGSDCLIS